MRSIGYLPSSTVLASSSKLPNVPQKRPLHLRLATLNLALPVIDLAIHLVLAFHHAPPPNTQGTAVHPNGASPPSSPASNGCRAKAPRQTPRSRPSTPSLYIYKPVQAIRTLIDCTRLFAWKSPTSSGDRE
ncbi:hypothetical protein BOTBODRAFT_391707 [Botryobasidium botryosum FD-172 SS1]|uniref:Uncharacterized protein n=1 Tax=Botryobasidium botryosum (strain FD-172 SS1) TaxID=930990 RepID=A0A067MWX4_BOTB1|nr:hypothetical protein BOTBODRAFT_391707 [Botryobasidium botryosum FD-172 SS1]